MLKELLTMCEDSRVNSGDPECLLAETLIFTEAWLGEAALKPFGGPCAILAVSAQKHMEDHGW